jgi:hypothetical protein
MTLLFLPEGQTVGQQGEKALVPTPAAAPALPDMQPGYSHQDQQGPSAALPIVAMLHMIGAGQQHFS